jgi:hypothetical protein
MPMPRGLRIGFPGPKVLLASTAIAVQVLAQQCSLGRHSLLGAAEGQYAFGGQAVLFSKATSTVPYITWVDFPAAPVSGGENNKGYYLTLGIKNAGAFSDWGVTSHVTIGGVEVDNYRCLVSPPAGSFDALVGVKYLRVQVGALTGLSIGTTYPVSVTVNGTAPANTLSGGYYLDPFGEQISFMPVAGTILVVDPVSGNNANSGAWGSPLKDLQTSTGSAGAYRINTSANGTDGIHPGTFIVCRSGTSTTTGLNNRGADLFRITGTAPTGAVDRGPICCTSYPGAAGANSEEWFTWAGPSGTGGMFNGNDSTRAVETSTSFGGFTGWCQYMWFSRVKGAVNAGSGADAGPFNVQNLGQNWRVIACEMTWPSTNSSSQARSGGVEGSPVNSRFYSNYIHDIYGTGAEADTNHGFYFDGFSSGVGDVAYGNIVAYNYIYNITFGNGVQFYNGVNSSDTLRSNTVAFNVIDTVHKHGVNISNQTSSVQVYNNLILRSGECGVEIQTSAASGTNSIVVSNNTIYGWGMSAANAFAIAHTSTSSGGTMRAENNICMQTPSHAANGYTFFTRNSTEITPAKNRWYDPNGLLTAKPTEDTTGSYGDPGFSNAAGGDFSLANGSACIDAGNAPAGITRAWGFALNAAPQGSANDQGAFERAA